MSDPTVTLQTFTTMEACMRLSAGTEDQFWSAQERIGRVIVAEPGFRAVIGGPIANSKWKYFCGKFETPNHMIDWYHSPKHKPVMDNARSTWFDGFYIRKWRLPVHGETLVGPLFCETAIVPEAVLSDGVYAATVEALTAALPALDALPFETVIGEFEPQPFQFVGPLDEFPKVAPVRYLLITHWNSEADLNAWMASAVCAALSNLGEVTHQVSVLIRHDAGERRGLSTDGSLRSWSRNATAS
jgi:hypothetical protein